MTADGQLFLLQARDAMLSSGLTGFNHHSHADCKATHGEVAFPALGSSSFGILLFCLQSLTNLLGLLGAQVQWNILLTLVLLAGFSLLLLVVHGQNSRNGLPHLSRMTPQPVLDLQNALNRLKPPS